MSASRVVLVPVPSMSYFRKQCYFISSPPMSYFRKPSHFTPGTVLVAKELYALALQKHRRRYSPSMAHNGSNPHPADLPVFLLQHAATVPLATAECTGGETTRLAALVASELIREVG